MHKTPQEGDRKGRENRPREEEERTRGDRGRHLRGGKSVLGNPGESSIEGASH